MFRRDLAYFLREALTGLRRHAVMAFAAVGTTAACLLIMGSVALVAYDAAVMLREQMEAANEIVAFVDETYSEARARVLGRRLLAVPNVSEARYISKEEAMDAYKGRLPDEELFQDLDPDILTDRYALTLEDLDLLEETVRQVEAVPGVAWVRVDETVAGGFLDLRDVGGMVSLTLVGALFLVSVFIIYNTIRMTTFDRREEIAVMRIVGATNAFIRWPFVFEGALIGTFGAAAAFLLQWGLYEIVAWSIRRGDMYQVFYVVPFSELWLPVAGAFLGAGALIGVIGSVTAIRKFLDT